MRNITVVLGCLLVVLACKSDDDFVAPVANQPQNPQTVSLQYAKNFGGSKNELASAVVKLQDGGYAVFGETQSIDIDITDKSDTSYDYWLLRFNAADELLWSKTYGGSLDEKGADFIREIHKGQTSVEDWTNLDLDVPPDSPPDFTGDTDVDDSGSTSWGDYHAWLEQPQGHLGEGERGPQRLGHGSEGHLRSAAHDPGAQGHGAGGGGPDLEG